MPEKTKRKRVMFPWVASPFGRIGKAFIAVAADNCNWSDVLDKSTSKHELFIKHIYPKFNRALPKFFKRIRKYYSERGRSLTKTEFEVICYNRLNNMFDISYAKSKVLKTMEHPLRSEKEEMKRAYRIAKKKYRNLDTGK